MENVLEDQRRLHEERERIFDVQTKEILRKKPTVMKFLIKKKIKIKIYLFLFFHPNLA